MTFETYLKNRALFESRYYPLDQPGLNYSFIDRMIKGIYNKRLFFELYGYDRKFALTMVVSSVESHKRYRSRGKVGSRICIRHLNHSMFEKFNGEFERCLEHIEKLEAAS